MSVIHEAMKQKEPANSAAKRPVPPASAPAPVRARGASAAWAAAGVAVFVALTALYWRETRDRQTAEAKLQAALLELNDARNEVSEAAADKARAVRQLDAVAAKQREVEVENFEKEKKIADLSKEVHELKIAKAAPPQA